METSTMAAPVSSMTNMLYPALDPCSNMDEENETMYKMAHEFTYISESVIQPTIFSIGIITNTLSIVVLKGVRMNKIFKICLLALAIADLCATLVGLIQILTEVIVYCGEVPEGYLRVPVLVNNALFMIFLLFMSISASLVVFIAFIRNIMYLKPMKARVFFTTKITKILCGVIFLTTFLMYAPTSLQVIWLSCYKEIADDFCDKINYTIPDLEGIANGYLYFNVAIYGPIMVLIYIANFICIHVTLRRSAKSVSQMTMNNGTAGKRSDTVTRITKTLSVILILDVICTLPSIIQSIGLVLAPEDAVFEKQHLFFLILDPIAEILLALRPTYNFWLYVFQRPEFRKRLRQIVHQVCRICCAPKCCPNIFSEETELNQSGQLTSSSGNLHKLQSTEHLNTASLQCTPQLNKTRKFSSSGQNNINNVKR